MDNVNKILSTGAQDRHALISVIIPVYHVEKYLRECLDSVLAQTLENIEVILVNDGGSEADTEICEEYADRDTRIHYIKQENAGLSAARNHGIDEARADLIMFVDSDDFVSPDFCEKAYTAITTYDADMVFFDHFDYYGENALDPRLNDLPSGYYDDTSPLMEARLQSFRLPAYVWSKLYRKELFSDIRFPVGELWEDEAIMHKLIDTIHSAVVIHESLYYKRCHAGSIMNTGMRDLSAEKWLYLQRSRRYDYMKEHHPEYIPLIVGDVAKRAVTYAACCLIVFKDKEGYKAVREWAKQSGIPRDKLRYKTRHAFRILCDFPLLFPTVAGILIKKLIKERNP